MKCLRFHRVAYTIVSLIDDGSIFYEIFVYFRTDPILLVWALAIYLFF